MRRGWRDDPWSGCPTLARAQRCLSSRDCHWRQRRPSEQRFVVAPGELECRSAQDLCRPVFSVRTTYRMAIVQAVRLEPHTAICTVYNGALDAERATTARVGLTLFNDVILRTAVDLRLDVIELRSICTEAADYANPIEPSEQGGLKSARAISRVVGAVQSADSQPARVWGLC